MLSENLAPKLRKRPQTTKPPRMAGALCCVFPKDQNLQLCSRERPPQENAPIAVIVTGLPGSFCSVLPLLLLCLLLLNSAKCSSGIGARQRGKGARKQGSGKELDLIAISMPAHCMGKKSAFISMPSAETTGKSMQISSSGGGGGSGAALKPVTQASASKREKMKFFIE